MKGIPASRYQQIVAASGALLVLIILTGSAVRLTQSGLGCTDWPKCTQETLVPEWGFHPWIEFGNRLLTGVIGFAVMAAALGSYLRTPRRADLRPWAWGLVAGVLAQAILGGITVHVQLHPIFVSFHYLLSIVLVWNVTVLWKMGASGPQKPQLQVPERTRTLSRACLALATLVLVVGTLVTGTGPNSGDDEAVRLSFDLRQIAQAHSLTAWVFVASVLGLAWDIHRSDQIEPVVRQVLRRHLQRVLLVTVLQGGIGYAQYLLGVPALLVELHVAGSVASWALMLWLHLDLVERGEERVEQTGSNSAHIADGHGRISP